MAPFDFKLENHFVGSSDGTSLQVYELTKSPSHFSSIQKADWKKVATIGPNNQDDDDDGGLLFFDGHGRIEEPEALAMLAGHLNQFRLLASPEGYCFQQASDFGMINYVRLNDLFSWSSYGVELVTMHKWNRLELKLKAKDEELRKVAKSKKNDDEAAKTEKEFEECRRNSWAILPSTKFIDAKEKHLAIRQRVPPTTFGCVSQMSFPYVNNSPRFVDKMRVDADYAVNVVDEETSPGEWPPPPAIMVHIGRGTDADFDKNNWWCLKTTHRDGGLTMLVYYEGNRSQISIFPYPDYDNIIRLPFSKDIPEVYTFYNHFDLFRLPFGVRFGFAYRPK
ncbi:hypothetical protein LINGRAHAP2_LOCUS8915 [Linum grandiflorum]